MKVKLICKLTSRNTWRGTGRREGDDGGGGGEGVGVRVDGRWAYSLLWSFSQGPRFYNSL